MNRTGTALNVGNGILGIHDEIQKYLFDLARITPSIGESVRQIRRDRNVVNVLLIFAQLYDVSYRVIQIKRDTFRLTLCCETQEILRDLSRALRLAQYYFDHTTSGWFQVASRNQLCVTQNTRQRIVQFMGNPR